MKTRQNILVIDDSADDREVYRRYLSADRAVDWQIVEASNAEDGLAAYRDGDDPIVLLDYSLPGQSGLSVLKELKGNRLYAPVVLLTGNGSEEIAVECMKQGAQDYLSKDNMSPESLRRAVHNARDRISIMRKLDEQRESLSVFARMLAHDLKAPIRHILNLSDMVSDAIEKEEYDEIETFREMLNRSGRHLQDLIDTLGEYNKLDGAEVMFQPVSMDAVVAQVVSQIAESLEESNAQVTHDPLPDVVGNLPQLAQLLQNLTANGIKFCEGTAPKVHIGAAETDGMWRISVGDNGIGIARDFIEEVFEPFRRLHPSSKYTGTGLGLAICRKIVERHGGEIWCESELGKGTTFYFTIPKAAPQNEAVAVSG